MIRIVIADDHAIVRGGLRQIFATVTDFEVIDEAVNGAEVIDCLRRHVFDLLLMDLNMPGLSGPDLIVRVRAHRPELPILVLSMHNEAQVAARVLKAGANGYITKDSEPELLISAMRKVAGGGKYIVPELAEKMVFDTGHEAPHTQLSDRELEVLRLLIEGLSINAIAQQLSISNKTVSTHKTRLMEKLNLDSMADLMRYAMQNDLMS